MWPNMRTDIPVLFYSPGACSLAVHIVLEEIGQPFDLVQVVTGKGETRTDKFKNVNPKGRLPVLAKGDWTLTEAHALIENRLADNTWALASGYTVLDPFLLVFYRWGNRMNLPMKHNYPNWTKHTNVMLERPAVSRTLATEGVSIWE